MILVHPSSVTTWEQGDTERHKYYPSTLQMAKQQADEQINCTICQRKCICFMNFESLSELPYRGRHNPDVFLCISTISYLENGYPGIDDVIKVNNSQVRVVVPSTAYIVVHVPVYTLAGLDRLVCCQCADFAMLLVGRHITAKASSTLVVR